MPHFRIAVFALHMMFSIGRDCKVYNRRIPNRGMTLMIDNNNEFVNGSLLIRIRVGIKRRIPYRDLIILVHHTTGFVGASFEP